MMGKKESEGRIGRKMNLVTNGTTVNAVKQKRTAEDCMCATSVGRVDTKERNVESLGLVPKCPKYLEWSV
jgi:hypothetical protein